MPKRYVNRPYAWRTVLPVNSRTKKNTVKECVVLSLKELFDSDLIKAEALRSGSWHWAHSNVFRFDGTIRYDADLRSHETASIRLQYEMDGLEIDYRVLLASEQQGLLGRRWWFRCPVNDVRVTTLYLPPGARRFASRQAHELIYGANHRSGGGRSDGGTGLVVIEIRKLHAIE